MPVNLPLFEGLNDVDEYSARRAFRERAVQPGEVLIQEGHINSRLLCVLDGSLVIRSGGVTLTRVGPGALVGEMALFEDGTASASVLADSPARILILDREGYEGLRDVLHPMAQNIERAALHLLETRVRAVGDRVADVVDGSPPSRNPPTARFFAAVAAQFGRGGAFSTEVVDPLGSLRRSQLFADAPEDAIKRIAAELAPEAYGPGAFVCTQGEVGQSMYFLDEGEIEVLMETDEHGVQKVDTLKPGSAFGMVALIDDRPRMASCVTSSRAVLLRLDREGWRRLIHEPYLAGGAFRRAMIRILSAQLAHSNHLIINA